MNLRITLIFIINKIMNGMYHIKEKFLFIIKRIIVIVSNKTHPDTMQIIRVQNFCPYLNVDYERNPALDHTTIHFILTGIYLFTIRSIQTNPIVPRFIIAIREVLQICFNFNFQNSILQFQRYLIQVSPPNAASAPASSGHWDKGNFSADATNKKEYFDRF